MSTTGYFIVLWQKKDSTAKKKKKKNLFFAQSSHFRNKSEESGSEGPKLKDLKKEGKIALICLADRHTDIHVFVVVVIVLLFGLQTDPLWGHGTRQSTD